MLQILIIGVVALSALMLLFRSKKDFVFILLGALYISQIFTFMPGSDVSPYAYSTNQLEKITVLGLSLSSWVSVILILFCFINTILNINKKAAYGNLSVLLSLTSFVLIGWIASKSVISSFDYVVKLLMPFVVLFYFKTAYKGNILHQVERLVLFINSFIVGQVLMSKIFTGKFAANKFYYEMTEEYFGYFNHAHVFTAILGLLTIWNIIRIYNRKYVKYNTLLCILNMILIFASGVRTYALAVAVSIFILLIQISLKRINSYSRIRKNEKKAMLFVAIIVLTIVVCIVAVLVIFQSSRSTSDVSSGRFVRWAYGLNYYMNDMGITRKLFGGGFQQINNVIYMQVGYPINSLNIFIDLLVDNGLVGLGLLMYAYFTSVKQCINKKNLGFILAFSAYIMVGSLLNNLLPYITITPLFLVMLIALRNYGIETEKQGITSANVSIKDVLETVDENIEGVLELDEEGTEENENIST